jgi:hypothetical protein
MTGIPTCHVCGWDENQGGPYRDRNGHQRWFCNDGIACVRRYLAQQGIKLLPHPKNPEGAQIVDEYADDLRKLSNS